MKWINHEIITGALVYAFSGGSLVYTGISLAGSVFPDMIEGGPPSKEEESPEKAKEWRKLHRRMSHWFVPYSLLAIVLLSMGPLKRETAPVLIPAGWFLAGCLFHLGEDCLCGYIPSLNPTKKIGARLFCMGSPEEYFLSFSVLVLIIGVVLS